MRTIVASHLALIKCQVSERKWRNVATPLLGFLVGVLLTMENNLSLRAGNQEIKLDASKTDLAAALIRGILGAAPIVGPMVAEAITAAIPNQKSDRVVLFIKCLEDKLKYLEADLLSEKMKSEQFGDLLEDALLQAARALTPERREYIASLLAKSFTETDLDHIAQKKLLSLLNELNDAEILILKFHSLPDGAERESMIARYPFVKASFEGRSHEELDGEKAILFSEYWGHLVMSNLVYGQMGPEEKATKLGLLLLEHIGL